MHRPPYNYLNFLLFQQRIGPKTIVKVVLRNETQGELHLAQAGYVRRITSETGSFYLHNKDGDITYGQK